VWESLEDLFEGNTSLQTSKRRAEAVMDAHTEADVLARRSVDIDDGPGRPRQ
jgi:hypothetical protein